MNEDVDVAIIGGGILGLALAVALRRGARAPRVAVLEKEDGVARHQSGRNSGVLHTGLYYAPGSMKARFCTRGRGLMLDYLARRGLPHRLDGKVVAALGPDECERLAVLEDRARRNGVATRRLTSEEAARREPALRADEVLFVPDAGVTDYGLVARALAEDLVDSGGVLRLGAEVSSLRREEDGAWRLGHRGGRCRARVVAICGGLHSDRLARAAGLEPEVAIIPFRGEYRTLTPVAAGLCRGLIYPVPDPAFPFLGVHFTRGLDGTVTCGPNAVLAFAREGYRFGRVSPRDLCETLAHPGFRRFAWRHRRTGREEMRMCLSRAAFARAARRLVPELRDADLGPGPAGVRAQAIDRQGRLVEDFAIEEGPGVLALLNAPSPAATSSLAIAEHLAALVLARL